MMDIIHEMHCGLDREEAVALSKRIMAALDDQTIDVACFALAFCMKQVCEQGKEFEVTQYFSAVIDRMKGDV